MAWLNFNDSLNNLKGQLSNFASGVLTDTGDDTELSRKDKKYEDLEQLIANQADEILTLRKENAEIYQKYGVAQNGHSQFNDKWSWDPPDTGHPTQPAISESNSNIVENLKKLVIDLENDKKELVASLEQLDLDCQQTTEKVINLKDELQKEYDDLKIKYDSLLGEYEHIQKGDIEKSKLLQQFQVEKAKFLKEPEKDKQGDNEELKGRVEELEEINLRLKKDLEEAIKHNDHAIATENINEERTILLKQIEDLNLKLKEYESCQTNDRDEYEKLARILQGYEEQVRAYEDQSERLQMENVKLLDRENTLVLELTALKETLDKSKDDMVKSINKSQERYLNLVIDSFKKFMDYPLPVKTTGLDENSFMAAVEATMKILLDLKWKTETLKKEVDDMTEEKTRILTEKNHEINKLLENSEVLSQEVITKTQALKNYEEENTELIKNNDDLINQLEMLKFNTRGLHTISESNEDNLLVLESQLEKANKKIKELEMTVSDLENSKQEATFEVQTELDYIKKQLNLTGTELNQTKIEYQKLLEEHKQLQLNHINLQNALDEARTSYDKCYDEKETLNSTVDKIQTEFENSEYKYSEININLETLKEETETLRGEIDSLTKSNKKLEMLNLNYESKNELIQNEVDDLKQQLTSEIDLREQQEFQIRSLSEKLQNAKMSETYFKLQNDTLNKELKAMTEMQQSLTLKYESLMQNYKETETYLKRYEEENLKLADKCKEIESIKQINDKLENDLNKSEELQKTSNELLERLKTAEEKILKLQEENENIKVNSVTLDLQEYENKISTLEKQCEELTLQLATSNQQVLDLCNEKQNLSTQIVNINKSLAENSTAVKEHLDKIEGLQHYIQELTNSRNEMVNFVNTKHQENVQYHNEIQRLNQVLLIETEKVQQLKENQESKVSETKDDAKVLALEAEIIKLNEEMEKLTDQNDFLRKKSEVLAQNLMEEQSKVQQILVEKNSAIVEKEASLSKELQRLRAHLLECEEAHTEEMVQAEKKLQEMLAKVNEIEQREKESSTHYTSMVTSQRDELRKKMSDAEDQISKQSAALSNLQFVLEQFQKDKEKDIYHETERIRRQINTEKQKQEDLQKEIVNLKNQLDESKQGLLAASRLNNQVETSKQQVASMKEEVTKLEEKLKKSEEKYNSLINQTDAKVDKMLVKNLIVGFVSANLNTLNKDQHQILKIIATVLDFNQEDNEKVNLNRLNQNSWLSSLLQPQVTNRGQEMSQESLSQAFVRFLENESKPRQLPNLLETGPLNSPDSKPHASNERPILLSEVVLPTFAEFGQNRNSSSILKDVLKDNN
ncbi:Gmap [Trypoxylus dichotomus]